MITYIRHDEEFYGVVKLTTGHDVIGKMIAMEEEHKTLLYIQDPAEVKIHELKNQHKENKITKGISFNKWFALSDEDFYIVSEETILSVASLSKEIIGYYNVWVKEQDPDYKSEIAEVEVTKDFGKLGTIKEAKQKLEKIFKNL
jgi:hypothetical protein